MLVAQHLPADQQNHRRVPLDQGRERGLGGLAVVRDEPRQQLAVAESS